MCKPESITSSSAAPARGELLLYTAEDGKSVLQVRFQNDNFWLSQKQMAELFQIRVPTLNAHLRNIFADEELAPESVIRNYLITASDGKNYQTKFYSLEVVLAVGYRVRSRRGVQFRQTPAAEEVVSER